MDGFARLIPFVWPHRGKLLLSLVFAVITAALWGANLSIAFPVVKVLLQGQSLGDYVDSEIQGLEAEINRRSDHISLLERRIAAAADASADVKLLEDLANQQSRLSADSWSLATMNWVRAHVIPWIPEDRFNTFALILGVLLAASLLKGFTMYVQNLLVGSAVELTMMDLRKGLLRRMLKLDYQTLSLEGTPSLMSKFTYDMNVLSTGLLLLGGKATREPLKAAACILFAFFVNWRLTLLSMLVMPLLGLTFYRIGRSLKKAGHGSMDRMVRIYKTLEETFDALKVVIAFGGARQHRRRFHRENREYYKKAYRLVQLDSLTSPVTELLGMLIVFVALVPGAYLVLRGTHSIWGIRLAPKTMDVAELAVLYALLAGVLDPLRKLSSVYSKLKPAGAAAERVFKLMDRQSLVNDPKSPRLMGRHAQSIRFENVSFRYATDDSDTRQAALQGVTLDVAAGEVVAVVGENGSGKSTLVNLLPRFYDPSEGAVLIDETDVRHVRLRDLRQQIGVVTQETLLFDDSVYENIRYGNPHATPEQIEEAARQAHVTQFLEQFPEGFGTRVGEKGGRLSGGQRQRIALARAILRNPAILILDEATSAIDAQSEMLIHQVLKSFIKGRTVFIITHSMSPSILDFVTRVAVMDNGRLLATGTHETLIRTCPVYSRLYQAQTHQKSA